jgi:hypothetical protein
MNFDPQPIDTSGVTLSAEVLELTEVLARNTHNVWARQRSSEGWRYGPLRDDSLKQHPRLLPYEELPESEKEYDRLTAMEALKTLIVFGYRIEKVSTVE